MNDIYTSKFKISRSKKDNNYVSKIFTKVLISIIFFLVSMIFINYSDSNRSLFNKYFFEQNFNFNYFTNLYNKYFGEILPPQEDVTDDKMVFNETMSYKNIESYLDGFSLEVVQNELIPILQSGLIVFVGEKEGYGNTIIIQGIDGVDIWYSNVNLNGYTLYDYVEKGKVLGEATDSHINLVFNKNGTFLGYEEYIN